MIDVKKNNWVLQDERHWERPVPPPWVMGLNIRIGWEKAPIFDEMQKRFWISHFGDQTRDKLLRQARALELATPNTKAMKSILVGVLADYYREKVSSL
jgi:hypothetical protein